MKHLRVGVKRGAFDEATCQKRFDEWKQAKTAGTEAFAKKLADDKKAAAQKALEEEKKTNEAIARRLQRRRLLPLLLRLRPRLLRLQRRLLLRRHPLRHKASSF